MLEMLRKEINDLCLLQDKYNDELIALFQKKSKNIYLKKKSLIIFFLEEEGKAKNEQKETNHEQTET